ncbi:MULTISPECIES: IpaD/SipD/SspD family type III secretion system needle tip protein [Pseudomonas]|uniref:IpaD/SipD/SspD family type III secretion system needle tip protein n=1 Tax=Pseudomonas quercus TaxID=2722792 RepID=A0ABX0Y9E6_9PSED|nr:MULTISPECIES: IpaD/SipD/SspD family type III secretion system needle tip protein [Pseudomonas]MBF7141017.1 IpaD/SipD/SspD family type III secretion system needle tip protein [Pseudomonas sp. LY10J]NJO99551.1 IpaD/SipD/SspD family type III secretion system needle tip protein [Pseudomonas quercus]
MNEIVQLHRPQQYNVAVPSAHSLPIQKGSHSLYQGEAQPSGSLLEGLDKLDSYLKEALPEVPRHGRLKPLDPALMAKRPDLVFEQNVGLNAVLISDQINFLQSTRVAQLMKKRLLEQAKQLVTSTLIPASKDSAAMVEASKLLTDIHAQRQAYLLTAVPPLALQTPGDGFFDGLQDLIALIGGSYLDIFEELVGKYTDFYEAFNDEIVAQLAHWFWTSGDNDIEFKAATFRNAVQNLINRYSKAPEGQLYPPDGVSATEQDARNWAAAMGLPESCVKQIDGKWVIMMDLTPLQDMIKSTQGWDDGVKINVARFEAWKTSFYGFEGAMKNYLQLATNKYSNANAYHDNFIKILSSQLSQFAEMLKGYANF